MNSTANEADVVMAVVVREDGMILAVERRIKEGSLGWAFPGGKRESTETEAATAERETFEETGVRISATERLGSWVHPNTGKHIAYWRCDYRDGIGLVREPDKAADVNWFEPNKFLSMLDPAAVVFPGVLKLFTSNPVLTRTPTATQMDNCYG